jgi:hypothetical protein
MFLLYSMMWTFGASEKIKVDAGRMGYMPQKGANIALIASIPNFLLAIFLIMGFVIAGDIMKPSVMWASDMFNIANAIARFIQAMYLGTIKALFPVPPVSLPEALLFLAIPLPAVAACGFGYFMGLKDKRILRLFGINTAAKDKNKRY